MKFSNFAAAAIAAVSIAGGVSASTVKSIGLDRGVGSSWSTFWNNPDFGGENVKAMGTWTFLGQDVDDADQWNFTLDLANQSDGTARVVSWGFDTSPTASDFTIASPSTWAGVSGQGVMDVDHCSVKLKENGNTNCTGGGNTSLAAESDESFAFNFTSSEDSITLDNFMIRFQSAGASGDSLVLEAQEHTTPIPLPAAGWMLLAGLGGLAALRRRKSV